MGNALAFVRDYQRAGRKGRGEPFLQVIEIDDSQQPEVASQWGVMSAPTTFIIDGKGEPRHANHGGAPFEKLLKQLKGLI